MPSGGWYQFFSAGWLSYDPTTSQPDRFTQFVRRQAGETLRLVVPLTGDSSSIEYVREDVVALVFPLAEGNVLVTVNPTAAQDLHEFAAACKEFLGT